MYYKATMPRKRSSAKEIQLAKIKMKAKSRFGGAEFVKRALFPDIRWDCGRGNARNRFRV